MLIDWDKVWRGFEQWIQERENCAERCTGCGRLDKETAFPDWEEQQDKIEELVDTQLMNRRVVSGCF